MAQVAEIVRELQTPTDANRASSGPASSARAVSSRPAVAAPWSPTTFSKNRDRLLESDIASAFFDGVLGQARAAGLLSDEHFTVDGTLLEAWASLKSFRRKDEGPTPPPDDPGIPTVNFPRRDDPRSRFPLAGC